MKAPDMTVTHVTAETPAERRERIATACMAGILADNCSDLPSDEIADCAVRAADALIARLSFPGSQGSSPTSSSFSSSATHSQDSRPAAGA
jgi:hypothetical protein